MEDRLTPATAILSAGVLTIDYTATGTTTESVTISNDGATISLTGDIAGATANAAGTVAQIVVQDSGGGSNQSLTFAGSAAFVLSGGLSASGVETVRINDAISVSGSGTLSITTPKSIVITAGLSTVSGDVNLSANQGTAYSNSFIGIDVNGATIGSTSGNVTLQGRGGDGATGSQYGVYVHNGSAVGSGTTGTVTITGQGGSSSGNLNYGVYILGTNSQINSSGGNVKVTGQGGGSGSSASNYGIIVYSGGQIMARGTGAVTVQGTGGAVNGGSNEGVYLYGTNSAITSADGDISVTGQGGGNSTSPGGNHGVDVSSGAQIAAGGTGMVAVQGTGGATGGTNFGVEVSGTIGSAGGNVTVTGQGGGSGSSIYGIVVSSGGQITAGGTGTVTVNGTGGAGSGNSNHGVYVFGTDSAITSTDGNVTVTGQGGGSGSSAVNRGVYVSSAGRITAGGSGTVTVQGTGGATSGISNYGVYVSGASSAIASAGGNVSVIGQGGGTNSSGTNYGIMVDSAGQITAGGTGTVTVQGTAGVSNGFSNYGVFITGTNAVITSSGGNVSVTGLGGTSSAGGNYGVAVYAGAQITAGGTGMVTVYGTGGTTSGGSNYGVYVTGTNTAITSAGGDVTVTGLGGGNSTSSGSNYGVIAESGGRITAGGTGLVTVQGIGGAASGSNNYGVYITGTNAAIASSGGDVAVIGQGGGSGSSASNYGIYLSSAGQLTAGETGAVMVQGTGGAGSGNNNYGVYVTGANVVITSSGGNVAVTGQGGGSGSSAANYGVYLFSAGQIAAGGSGTVSVTGSGGNMSGTGNSNYGVYVRNTDSAIRSAGGNVSVIGSGGGGSLGSNFGVYVYFGGQITAGGTGTVTVQGTGGVASGGGNTGVYVTGTNAVISSSGGDVLVIGSGGGGLSASNIGVYVGSAGQITAGGTGTVTVQGTGGAANGDSSHGVDVAGTITSSGGNVSVTGQGRGTGTSSTGFAFGVQLFGGQITAGGTGTVTVQGTGGAASGGRNYGVYVTGTNAMIGSAGGAVYVTGQGGGTGASDFNYGVSVYGAQITAGGTGAVTVQGAGGAASGGANYGVDDFGLITSAGGDVSVTGISGNSSSAAIYLEPNGTVSSGGTADLTLVGDSLGMDVSATIRAGMAGDAAVTIRTRTMGTRIDVGGPDVLNGSPLTLGLSNTELSRIFAGTLVIGDTSSGSLTVSNPVSYGGNLRLTSGADVRLAANVTATGNVTLDATNGVKQTSGTITAGALQLLGSGTFDLFRSGNYVTTLAADIRGDLRFRTGTSLTVGTVETTGIRTGEVGVDGGLVWLWAASLNVAALIDTGDGTGGQLLEGSNVSQTVTPQVGAGDVVLNTLAPVTVTGITAQDKVYDSTTTATLNIGTPVLLGVFFGDGVSLNTTNATGTFADQNVGTGKAVSIAGLTLTGTNATDYALFAPITAAAITPRPITVTADAKTKVYGTTDPSLTYRVTSGSLVGGDNFAGNLTRQAGETVASSPYAITQGTLGLSINYTLGFVGANFAITPRPVTVTADPKGKFFGDPDPALTFTITSGSLAFSDSFSGGLARDPGEAAGTYAIGQGTLALGGNYTLGYVGANFSISLAPVLPHPDSLIKGMVGTGYRQVFTATGGILTGYTFTVTAGTLPTGLFLTSAGVLHGTPTTAGTFDFTITAQDGAGHTGSRAYSLINQPAITLSPTTLADGTAGTAYAQSLSATGGNGSFTYAISTGALPGGLDLDTDSGQLTGTPTIAGTFGFTVTATDDLGHRGSKAYTVTVAPALTLSPTLATGVAGSAYSQSLSATGGSDTGFTFALSAGALPGGLSLSGAGLLSGTPTVAGTFTFTVTASDSGGLTGSRAYALTVNPALTLNPATPAVGTTGLAFSQTFTATGGSGTGYTFARTAGTLPTGLSLSTAGLLHGKPTAAGTFNFTVRARDSQGHTTSRAYTVLVGGRNQAIVVGPTSLAAGAVGTAYSQAIRAGGGSGTGYTFARTTGTLPAGLTLSSTGHLSGTPTTAGSFSFTVRARDSAGRTGTRSYTLMIKPTLALSPATLPAATAGTAYSTTVSASGGSGSNSFKITAGALPGGLSLSGAGLLSGVPTISGTFGFTVLATDSQGRTGSRAYFLSVAQALTLGALDPGTVGNAFSQAVGVTGSSGPYTFAVTAGALPGGLSLDADTGLLSGTPTVADTFSFTVTATDSTGLTGSRAYTLTVAPALTISPATLPAGTVGVGYSQTLSATGGSSYVYTVLAGALPDGLDLTPEGALLGTPLAAGTFDFTVLVTDGTGQTGSRVYHLTIGT